MYNYGGNKTQFTNLVKKYIKIMSWYKGHYKGRRRLEAAQDRL